MKKFSRHLISSGSFLLAALLFADGLNFLFNAFLGRVLTFEEFGLVTLITTLWNFVNIFLGALATTVNHRTAYLSVKIDTQASTSFYASTLKRSIFIALLLSGIWMFTIPFLSTFFDIDTLLPLFSFTPMIALGTILAVNRGFLQGSLSFAAVGMIIGVETVVKFVSALLFIFYKQHTVVYLTVPLSIAISCMFSLLLVFFKTPKAKVSSAYQFPKRFFAASVLTGLSTTFLVLDVILAKHFLSPTFAGQYAFLSLVGKMVFFFGSLLNVFVVTLVSRAEGLQKDPQKTFYRIFAIAFFMTLSVYIFIGLFGYITIPALLGKKAFVILPYLPLYGLAITFFTLSNQVVIYHLARHHYQFPITAITFAGAIILGIMLFHANIAQIVIAIFVVSLINFATIMALHILQEKGIYVVRNIIDLFEAFLPLAKQEEQKISGKRILIFNWRDIRHVYAGGAEVYIHEIAKRWVKKGCKVTLFCGNDSISPRHEVIDGVEIVRRGGFYFVYVWAFVYYFMRFRNKYDIIIDAQNGIPFFTPLYIRKPIYCLMFHVHQEFFRKSLSHPMVLLAYFLEKKAMPIVYRNIQFLTISQSTKHDMQKLGLGKAGITIVYPGVSLSTLQPGKKNDHPMVLYLGRLKAYKSVHVLIKAAEKILKEIPQTEFVIAGFGEEEKKLKKFSQKLGIANNISFLGKVTEEQKVELYQKAWVFVNPSLIEGWGITTIEANACGTPTVASDVPGLRDSVNNPHTGFLVPYGNSDAFAKNIMRLLTEKKLLHNMSQHAILWADKFDWEKSARMSLTLLLKTKYLK